MKVVHISTYDSGGAGIAAYRLHLGLLELGVDSKMLVLYKSKDDDTIYAVEDFNYNLTISKKVDSPIFNHFWFNNEKLLSSFPNRPENLELFSAIEGTIDLSKISIINDADIINFHWVSGFVNWEKSLEVLKHKRLFWTLHDQNPFTGGCHYSGNCQRFKNNCGVCFQLGSESLKDLSYEILKRKKNLFNELEIEIVSPSKWLNKLSKESSLFKEYKNHCIPYGFPVNEFIPYNKEEIRKTLNIPFNAPVLLFGAAYDTKRKGLDILFKALEYLTDYNNQTYLGVFGYLPNISEINNSKFEIIQFGKVNDTKELAMIYSMSDIFVIPSLEDNLPNVVVESLLCNTPVVGFNTGGIPDMINHKINGYLAECFSSKDLANGIRWVIDNNIKNKNLRNEAIENFKLSEQAKKYFSIYKNSISKQKKLNKKINIISKVYKKISIVTPSYNQGEFIEETIDSVISQNYPNLEYIIMDGGSNDNTIDIIKKYKKHLAFWVSKPDEGQYAAINEGFQRISGEIMTWINSDDLIAPGAFEIVNEIFNQKKEVDWITGRVALLKMEINDLGFDRIKIWNRKDYLFKNYKYIQQEGTFWRKSLFDKAGGYISTKYKLASDLELWVRFFRYAKLYSTDCILGIFRQHAKQKTSNFLDEYNYEADKIIELEKRNFKISENDEAIKHNLIIRLDDLNIKEEEIDYYGLNNSLSYVSTSNKFFLSPNENNILKLLEYELKKGKIQSIKYLIKNLKVINPNHYLVREFNNIKEVNN